MIVITSFLTAKIDHLFFRSFSVFKPRLLIFAANLVTGMMSKSLKSLLVAVFSMVLLVLSKGAVANGGDGDKQGEKKEEKFDAATVIMEHIKDGHSFHFFTAGEFHAAIPLPVILYSPQKGWSVFSSSHFGHENEETYQGYKLENGDVVAVNADGTVDKSIQVYDFSLTRNVVQMILALVLLVWLMIKIAGTYSKGQGLRTAPRGIQSLVEPVITFVRDDIAKPNLGHKYEKYLPYLLTVFFFILINNILGLIPGSANVTGNIAFTFVLAIISLVVILFSSNGHFWGHIFWPPGVPFLIKIVLVPVEFAGVFIKPVALMIRLFANMVAGHIIIISFISLIFIFGAMNQVAGWGFSPFSILFTVFIYLIEILVAFIQAYIFTNLTAVFVGQAFEGSHDDHHKEGFDDPVII
jgi:F-type H+-transporting ATPase subunit a